MPGCGPGVFAAGPRDQAVAEVGVEPTIGHQALDLAALPLCVLGHPCLRFALAPYQRARNASKESCGGRIRTGVERLMRPCWKPDSSPLRNDQGESRTPMPLQARRSERRVSAGSTTWPCSSYGNRTHLEAGILRPIDERAVQCVGQELNLHSVNAGGLQPLRLANAQPTHSPSSTGGS